MIKMITVKCPICFMVTDHEMAADGLIGWTHSCERVTDFCTSWIEIRVNNGEVVSESFPRAPLDMLDLSEYRI